jgi:hypothetical protein
MHGTPRASSATAMATSSASTEIHRHPRVDADDDEASIVELVERAIGGARDLATHEATLAMAELEHDVRRIRTMLVLALSGASCVAVSVAWGGVALALALGVGALGLGVAALVLGIGGAVALLLAREHLPPTLLGKSRARLERRIARVTETLK